MEQNIKEKKVHSRNRKVAKVDRKRGKKPSRREKKPLKNVEKKTRSGCIYSPYEIFFEKSGQNQFKLSDLQTQTNKSKLALPRKFNISGPTQQIGNLLRIESEENIATNKESEPVNTMNSKQNISGQKILLNCGRNSVEDRKEKNSNQEKDKTKKPQVLPAKNARKRGRKPRMIAAEADIKHQFLVGSSSWPSDRQNETQLHQPVQSIKQCEEVKDEEKLNCITLNIRGERDTHHFIEHTYNQQELSLGKANPNDIKTHENERNDSVEHISNESGDEMMNLNMIGHSNLLDLVIPDPELNHTISEEELGSCVDHGCYSTKPQDFEEHVIRRLKPECASNCMFTDTDKYLFKSCFKNIHSQIQNFDRYRGAETPGGEASLYDVSEASPIDTRKLYRKNFSDLKLNMWYNYVYHSAQLARIGGNAFSTDGPSNNSLSLDMQLDDIFLSLSRGGSSSYLPGENIWRCNFLKGIPSVDEVLNGPCPSDFHYPNRFD